MDWLSMTVIGVAVGLLARMVFSGERPMGMMLTSALGVAGSVLAAVPAQAMGVYRVQDPNSIAYSVFGSVLLLAAYGLWVCTRPR